MAELTEKEILNLNSVIEEGGLTYIELQNELLDHLCGNIEAEMDEGLEFAEALEKVKIKMGHDSIRQIQEETLVLINQKYRVMKKFMYVLGIIAPSMLIIGSAFKMQHWPGAGVLIVLSLFLLGAIYLPVFVSVKIRDTRKKGIPVNMPMYIFGLIAGIIYIAGAMFKIMHWPGASVMIYLSGFVTIAVFIPILIIQAIKDKENQVQNFTVLIFVLSFVAITIMMFALRSSRNVMTSFSRLAQGNLQTNEIVETRNSNFLKQLNLSFPESTITMNKVNEISEKTDLLNDYIRNIMKEIVVKASSENLEAVSEKGDIIISKLTKLDNYQAVEFVMLGDEEISGKGKELKLKIEAFRKFIANLTDPELATMIDKLLDTKPIGKYNTAWEESFFNQTPMISAVIFLSNLQAKVLYIEKEVLSQVVHQQISEDENPQIP